MIAAEVQLSSFPLYGSVPDSVEGKSFSRLVDRLLARTDLSQQVLVTSAGEGEGKSVTAINLAYAFHVRGISVLLAELAFERSSFSEVFGAPPSSLGMEDALALGAPLHEVVCERVDGLNVALASGTRYPQQLLAPGAALDRVLSEVRAAYTWTIFDGPSVDSMDDVAGVAAAIGTTIVVARAKETESRTLLKTIATINHPGTLVLLNDV
jgi:Mrp family chromosome partitioning ATPase